MQTTAIINVPDTPEPCALIRRDGSVQSASRAFLAAPGLCRTPEDESGHEPGHEPGHELGPEVREALVVLIAQGGGRRRVVVQRFEDRVVHDLILLPVGGVAGEGGTEGGFLLIAQDRTLESGLRNALAESRARYRDLVSISGDQPWEVDATGAFSFIAPDGLAGHPAGALIGTPAVSLVDTELHADPVNPFATPVPLTGMEVWVLDPEKRPVCLEVAAVPLFDKSERWVGARGLCRDVTEPRRRSAEVAEARTRDRVLARIMRLFQCEADPESMVRAAASAIAHGLSTAGCQVFGRAISPHRGVDRPRFEVEAAFGHCGTDDDARLLLRDLHDASKDGRGTERLSATSTRLIDGRRGIAILTAHGDRPNGALVLWLDGMTAPFTDGDLRLLRALAVQIGVALEQLTQHRLLVEVSRTDPLTGLFNRRAFHDDLQRRVRRLTRSGGAGSPHGGALLYVDLDNFKQVNDTRGHDVGDAALRDVADLLRTNTRTTDLVARLGGDEFAVWLEDADEAVARKRAEVFLAASAILRRYSGSAKTPLMLSIGVALYDPVAGEELDAFLRRADAAMYAVKRRGKGSYGIAPPLRAAASPSQGVSGDRG